MNCFIDPFDVVKTRIQSMDPAKVASTDMLITIQNAFKESGIRGLTRGFLPTIVRTVPAAGNFSCY